MACTCLRRECGRAASRSGRTARTRMTTMTGRTARIWGCCSLLRWADADGSAGAGARLGGCFAGQTRMAPPVPGFGLARAWQAGAVPVVVLFAGFAAVLRRALALPRRVPVAVFS